MFDSIFGIKLLSSVLKKWIPVFDQFFCQCRRLLFIGTCSNIKIDPLSCDKTAVNCYCIWVLSR